MTTKSKTGRQGSKLPATRKQPEPVPHYPEMLSQGAGLASSLFSYARKLSDALGPFQAYCVLLTVFAILLISLARTDATSWAILGVVAIGITAPLCEKMIRRG